MSEREIDHMLSIGYWIQVSPLANAGSGWVCGVYKRGKKTGNWITEVSRTFDHPYECYNWAEEEIYQLLHNTN